MSQKLIKDYMKLRLGKICITYNCDLVRSVLRDYYMTFSISALVLARDSHIKPDSEAGVLIWVEG